MNKKISSALISVFYKDGLEPVVKQLEAQGATIYTTGGTQKFGLAQTNNLYVSSKHSSAASLNNTEKSFITERSQFQLFSLSARLRTEFSKGIFFVQPQLMFDYYLPEPDHTVATSFVLNAGILF